MSSGENEGAAKRTRGKGSRKAGRGPDSDMEESADSEAAEDAQQTLNELEDNIGDSPSASAGGGESGSEGGSNNTNRFGPGTLTQRETDAVRSLIHSSVRVVGEIGGKSEDRLIDAVLEEAYEKYKKEKQGGG